MKGNLIEAPSLASSAWGFRSRFEGREDRQSIESPPSYLARSSIRWDGMGLLAGGDEHHWSPLSFLSLAVGPAGTSGIWRCGGRGPTVQRLMPAAAAAPHWNSPPPPKLSPVPFSFFPTSVKRIQFESSSILFCTTSKYFNIFNCTSTLIILFLPPGSGTNKICGYWV